ncbi:MAG TPA: hypothetical protein VJS66_08665 [Burkholderiales bacterium]|nr:hypothetical protein [Burkholderiales bacterium]
MKKLKRNFASNSLVWQIGSVVVLGIVIGLAVFNVNSRDETITELKKENYQLQVALEYALNRKGPPAPLASSSKVTVRKH